MGGKNLLNKKKKRLAIRDDDCRPGEPKRLLIQGITDSKKVKKRNCLRGSPIPNRKLH